MGLKITSNVQTNKGQVNSLYIMIDRITVPKFNSLIFKPNVNIKTYVSKIARDANQNDTCETFVINKKYNLDISLSEVEDGNIYSLAYAKLKTLLENNGFTVEDK